ncbi:hypothetical protein SCA6_001561 [Theobroma cacao]
MWAWSPFLPPFRPSLNVKCLIGPRN